MLPEETVTCRSSRRAEPPNTGPWLAGNEGMEKNMENTRMGFYRDYFKDPFLHS